MKLSTVCFISILGENLGAARVRASEKKEKRSELKLVRGKNNGG
jgi:hypothetical protein